MLAHFSERLSGNSINRPSQNNATCLRKYFIKYFTRSKVDPPPSRGGSANFFSVNELGPIVTGGGGGRAHVFPLPPVPLRRRPCPVSPGSFSSLYHYNVKHQNIKYANILIVRHLEIPILLTSRHMLTKLTSICVVNEDRLI